MRGWRGLFGAGMLMVAAGLVPATTASAGVSGSVTVSQPTIAAGESTTATVNVTVTEGTLPGLIFAPLSGIGDTTGLVQFTNVTTSPGGPLSCTVASGNRVECTWAEPTVGDTATFTATVAAGSNAGGEWLVGAGWADQQGLDQGGIVSDGGKFITVTPASTTTTTTTTIPVDTTTSTTTTAAPPSTSTTSTTTSTTSVPTVAATSTVAWSSANPSVAGQPVTFTAVVSPAAPPAAFGFRRPGAVSQVPADGGSVTFNDGDTVLGTVPVEGGTASLTTSSLAAGRHTITASFSGTATAAPSGAAFIQQVNPPAPAATLPATR